MVSVGPLEGETLNVGMEYDQLAMQRWVQFEHLGP